MPVVGKVVDVQIDAAITIAEVIRRTRFAANFLPIQSPNPRLTVEGKEVGHMMLVGEIGISASSQLDLHVGVMDNKH